MTWLELVARHRAALEHYTRRPMSLDAARRALHETFELLGGAVMSQPGGRVAIPRFGSFVRRKRKARRARHVGTGKMIKLPRTVTLGFRPARCYVDKR